MTGRDHRAVRLGLRPGTLTLTVQKAQGGSCKFETYCDYRSEPASADFDPVQFIEVLSIVRNEPFDLELNGPGIPAVLHAAGLCYCVMPLPRRKKPGAEEQDGDEGPAGDEEAAPEVEEEDLRPWLASPTA